MQPPKLGLALCYCARGLSDPIKELLFCSQERLIDERTIPHRKFFFCDTKSPKENLEKNPAFSFEARKIWDYIREELRSHLNEEIFKKWISPVKSLASNEDELILVVPSISFYQVILSDYLETIERCKNKLGFEHISIVIDLERETVSTTPPQEKTLFDESENEDSTESPIKEKKPKKPLPKIKDAIENSIEKSVTPPIEALAFQNTKDISKTTFQQVVPSSFAQEDENNAPPNSDFLFSHTLSRKTKLNTNYTFENFIRGPSNQFALAACYNVAENPGCSYNPLFIYGATGLGKTHLLHAVGNHILKANPEATIAYISSERFMNELIYCLRHNKIVDFRQKYRNCDLFLMDDIQFISGNKAATQEEFFHTFNTLYETKKQIIITSDLFPQEIPDIEERLRNRFQWGLIADIQPPDIEHRIAILFSKAKQLGIRLNSDVAEYIANLVKRNVRELEGALHRLAAFAALQGRPLDRLLAIETFSTMLKDESSKPQMLIEAVQKIVADHFQIKISDLKSKRRHKALTLPRQVAMYLSRQFTKTSYPEIGEKFGGKDHTTIMHAVQKISLERKRNMNLMAHLETLERVLERLC